MSKPYTVTLAPFVGVTEVKIVRTRDGALIHQALHRGGTDRALRIANAILDRETGIDTTAAEPPPAVNGVSLRRTPMDLTRLLVMRVLS
jgi:hypothetical protein